MACSLCATHRRPPQLRSQGGLDTVTQTNAIAARLGSRMLMNSTKIIDLSAFEAFGIATLSAMSGLSVMLLQKWVPRERRAEFEEAARVTGSRQDCYGAPGGTRRAAVARPATSQKKGGGPSHSTRIASASPTPPQAGASLRRASYMTSTIRTRLPVRPQSLLRCRHTAKFCAPCRASSLTVQ